MLQIKLQGDEYWDEENQRFIYGEEKIYNLEHSLFAISKWESKWHKPFLEEEKLTSEQMLDYIHFMCLEEIDELDLLRLASIGSDKINNYISDKMTATWFSEQQNQSSKKEIITAEIIYYWMNELNIPLECEHWHFNKLMAYIRVCSIKRQPQKKMPKADIHNRNRALNAARRAKSGSKG